MWRVTSRSSVGLLLLSLCLLSVCCRESSAARPWRPPRRRHHQGETLKRPEEFLDGVDVNRFRDMLESHYGSRKSSGVTGRYSVGVGIGDVTGQVAEFGFMGYASPEQKGTGLLQRPRARAFVFVDDNPESKTYGSRVAYVSMDLCMGFHMMKQNVLDALAARFGALYTDANVLISGQHTHATPGGIGGAVLVDLTTLGFSKENHFAAVNGIVRAIVQAHNSVQPAVVKLAVGQCDGCNINRSPSAYLLDPDASQYANNTDHEMTVLRIESANGTQLGMLSFFAVHGTSLNNTNTLVSGDNKGYASYAFERAMNPPGTLPGHGPYVAAFGQSNLGDVSPNTRGARCPDGSPCDFNTSTCGNPPRSQGCIATGPGVDQYDSMRIIGQMQVDAAMALYQSAITPLDDSGVDFRHAYFNMQFLNVSGKFTSTGQPAQTCAAGIGYSFAGGTTDGAGAFDFTQGTTHSSPFWDWVISLVKKPSAAQVQCHYPKPILFDVGEMQPIEWSAYILPEQVFRIGQLWILAVPGEFTTMSGRRLRRMVQAQLQAAGEWTDDSHVVIAGLANSYSHYITTYEEYQQQRYEGASTLYGPHTLAAHMQNFAGLVDAMLSGSDVPPGPQPLDMRNMTISFMPGVVNDGVPPGVQIGDVLTDVAASYRIGATVSVTFWGASPRNDLLAESSFLYVDAQQSDGSWLPVRTDSDIDTRFMWTRVGVDQSHITVEWQLEPQTAQTGTYRIRHQGVWKAIDTTLTPYNGTSSTFRVTH